ncbi:hypothetical protein KIN20_003760 [Parelaphostrongylus tenuis]|uniref:Uncharacterized protein n=1 Tax=Parelaphostrongylus tenuis TaxID=148309 RepID=A0AAD5QGE0_PARTN|nr:hypothetical protein KIN20_003760 [Parelaphostrongylus tenuis]
MEIGWRQICESANNLGVINPNRSISSLFYRQVVALHCHEANYLATAGGVNDAKLHSPVSDNIAQRILPYKEMGESNDIVLLGRPKGRKRRSTVAIATTDLMKSLRIVKFRKILYAVLFMTRGHRGGVVVMLVAAQSEPYHLALAGGQQGTSYGTSQPGYPRKLQGDELIQYSTTFKKMTKNTLNARITGIRGVI